MANTVTTLGLIKPEVGADNDAWGGHYNSDMDLVDTLLQRFVGTTTTRLLTFNVSGVSTTTTRNITWIDESLTVVGAANTQTLTNKTLTDANVNTQGAGNNTTKAASTQYVDRAVGTALRGYLAGLTCSKSSNTVLAVSAGVCCDDTGSQMMAVSSGSINTATTGANGLDTGSLSSSTTYYVYVIGKTDGTVAHLASASASAPTMPSGYTLKRLHWMFLTDGSSHIVGFTQIDDYCLWASAVVDVNATPISNGVPNNYNLSVPTGVRVLALMDVQLNVTGSTTPNLIYQIGVYTPGGIITGPSTETLSFGTFDSVNTGGAASNAIEVWTDTSKRVTVLPSISDGAAVLTIVTKGWRFNRQRNA